MKIMHLCLAAFYIDDYGYQENILPKAHKKSGHDVEIVASTEVYSDEKTLTYCSPKKYVTRDSIPITRLPYYFSWLPLNNKFRAYKGLEMELRRFSPDIIFLHDCQFWSVSQLKRYLSDNKNVIVYADCHTDWINSGKNIVSKYFFHLFLYKKIIGKIINDVRYFYGVTPLRSEFLRDVYGVPASKIKLLPLGYDDTDVTVQQLWARREFIREELGIGTDEFVISFGGKIDARKNLQWIVQAVDELRQEKKSLRLVIYGDPVPEMKGFVSSLTRIEHIKFLGWKPPEEISQVAVASDLGVFPGTHSVLWEQYTGLGVPCIFGEWDGIKHLDVGGNCVFVSSRDDLFNQLKHILFDVMAYKEMLASAKAKGPGSFSYTAIANKAIEVNS